MRTVGMTVGGKTVRKAAPKAAPAPSEPTGTEPGEQKAAAPKGKRPAPKAAAIGSSMTQTCLAPAFREASFTARFSTSVTPEGMQMTTYGFDQGLELQDFLMKYSNIALVTSKSAITPSFSGRIATIEPGVRPMTSFASCPTRLTILVFTSTATTLGSRIMMPLPLINTSVFAVPRSIPIYLLNILTFSPFSSQKPVS